MESKPVRIIVALIIAIFLMLVSFAGGIFTGINLPSNLSLPSNFSLQTTAETQATPAVTNTPVDRETLFKPFWQAWDLIHKQYVDQPLDDTTLMRGAISGMLSSLGDPNTAYMDPIQYQ